MLIRTLMLLGLIFQLSGCMVTPRIELAERLDFDYVVVDQQPLSYDDVLCCEDCHA